MVKSVLPFRAYGTGSFTHSRLLVQSAGMVGQSSFRSVIAVMLAIGGLVAATVSLLTALWGTNVFLAAAIGVTALLALAGAALAEWGPRGVIVGGAVGNGTPGVEPALKLGLLFGAVFSAAFLAGIAIALIVVANVIGDLDVLVYLSLEELLNDEPPSQPSSPGPLY